MMPSKHAENLQRSNLCTEDRLTAVLCVVVCSYMQRQQITLHEIQAATSPTIFVACSTIRVLTVPVYAPLYTR